MEKIVHIVPDAVHSTVLLCLVKTGTKSVYDILVFRCSSDKDAKESAEVFRRLRALHYQQNPNQQPPQQLPNSQNFGSQHHINGDNRNGFYTATRQSQNGQMMVISSGSPGPLENGAEEQEEAILVVTPDPGAMSPSNDDAILSQQIHQQHMQRQMMSQQQSGYGLYRRSDENDSAFKRRMRHQVREALKRGRSRSEIDPNMLAIFDSDTNESYMADSEYDQVSLSESMNAQQRALNDKVSYIAEEVNRLRSVFENTLRQGVSTNVLAEESSYPQNRYRRNRSTSSESRSRSPAMGQPGQEPIGVFYSNERPRSPYNRDEMSPPLAPGEMYRRRALISEHAHMSNIDVAMSPTSPSTRSRRMAYVYKKTQEPDTLYVQTGREQRGSMNDLLIGNSMSPSRNATSSRRINQVGVQATPMVRANIPQHAMRSSYSINQAGGGGAVTGTSSSKISSKQRRQGGHMHRSRSSQWLSSGNLAQVVSTQDLYRDACSPEADDRIRRQRELADRIRSSSIQNREVVQAKAGVIEREKWELGPEPLYLIRSDNKTHQDRSGGVKLYKARSVPNFLATQQQQQQQQQQQMNRYQQQAASKRPSVSSQQQPLTRGQNGQPTYYVAVQPHLASSKGNLRPTSHNPQTVL